MEEATDPWLSETLCSGLGGCWECSTPLLSAEGCELAKASALNISRLIVKAGERDTKG